MPCPYSIPPHGCPPPILSHFMHTLPLFYPSPCMTSPYFIPPHAHPPPILSLPMHASSQFYPSLCTPSPYSNPPHAHPPPILTHPMHAIPQFYPNLCTPSPYSNPPHACHPPILSQPMHTLPLLYSTPCMPYLYSIPSYACPLPILSQPMHGLLTPCHTHLEGMFLLWHLSIMYATFQSAHTGISSSFTKLSNLKHQFMTPGPECLLFHSQCAHPWATPEIHVNLHIYHTITTYIVYHYSSVDITHSST